MALQHGWEHGEGGISLFAFVSQPYRPTNCPDQVEGCSFKISWQVWKGLPESFFYCSVDVPFCNTHLNLFVPLAQPHFLISVLNSACGLALTFLFMEVDFPIALPANAYFIFPARAVHRGSFLPSWTGRRRTFPLFCLIGQVLPCRWIGRRMKWCCPAWLLYLSYY